MQHTDPKFHSGTTLSPSGGAGDGGGSPPPSPRMGGLGTTAKFPATPIHAGLRAIDSGRVDPETGEIGGDRTPAQCRLERYALQSVVRELLPSSRTAKCLRYVQHKRASVDVFRSVKYQRAHYGGLQTCSSVWACPVCSAKISERRRAELAELIQAHEATGGVVLLVTRTVPHRRTDDLGELLAKIASAERSYTGHRDYKALMSAFGLVGKVRALEVTHGEANGWHPHVHELVFLAQPVNLADLEEDLSRIWQGAALRAGLDLPSRAHGLTVQDGSKAAKYASKWGLESELTQWHRKHGKIESRTPFDLLRAVLSDGDAGASRAALLFRQYAEAFHGRHQLQFSRGLRQLYQVEDWTDEELAAKQDDDAELLGSIQLNDWRMICKMGQRGAVLEVASTFGWSGVEFVLDGLRRAYAMTEGPP